MVDKFPQINAVKILHGYLFFFQGKTCYVNHALSFLFAVSFFNRLWVVIETVYRLKNN